MSMIYCLYDTGSGSLWRSETRCNVTYKRMKKPWAFLIFNTQSTFCRDTAKANCENKEIQKNWNDAVSVSLLPVQWIVKQKCQWNVDSMMESVSPAHERAGKVSNSSPACWLCLLAAGNVAFSLREGMKGKQRGILSRFSTPSGINRAIPPQLVSPERLIGWSLFRVLLIGCYKDGGLYLIGSGATMGWVKGWDLSSATKSKSISESPSVIFLCACLNVPVWLSVFKFLCH